MSPPVCREIEEEEEVPFLGLFNFGTKPSIKMPDDNSFYISQDNYDNNKRKNPPLRPQITLMAASFICTLVSGLSFGHSAVLLPELQNANTSSIVVDEDTGSWIASVYMLAGPMGALFSGVFVDVFGRRWGNLLASVWMTVGWVLIMMAQNVSMILIGRIIEGFAKSMVLTTSAVTVDELADPRFRGSIISVNSVFIATGIFLVSALSSLLPWRVVCGIGAAISVVCITAFAKVPETPTWLVRKNRLSEAENSVLWVWGPNNSARAQKELQELRERYQPRNEKDCNNNIDLKTRTVAAIRSFFTAPVLKPFLIIHIFNIVQAICGHSIFTFYTIDFLSRMRTSASMDENLQTILISVVRIIGVILSSISMFRLGRRRVGLLSGVGASVSGIALAGVLYLKTKETGSLVSLDTEAWLLFALIVTFVGSHAFGFYPLPPVMIGETQPAHIRSVLCGYIFTTNDIVFGIISKNYISMVTTMGIHGLFIFFSLACTACTVFIYLFLPETQGKSLMEIEDYFKLPNLMWITRHKYVKNDTKQVQESKDCCLETRVSA
ncbi:facilitated trehalose transporter Tret1-like [Periplaneta americana]|uniref:facilitated trehalose transporter Tret1-like n=1 Tax=Periplaneta americana TaxID=6978 RepID=UPI0037E7E790